MEAEIESVDGDMCSCRVADALSFKVQATSEHKSGDKVTLAIRPEKVQLGDAGNADGEITETVYLGTDTSYNVSIGDNINLMVRDQNALSGVARFSQGQNIRVDIPESALRMLLD